jgi:hypothetical protein
VTTQGQVLAAWDKAADDFKDACMREARADVAWTKFAAKRRIELRAEADRVGRKVTIPDLEAEIVNDDADGLLLEKVLSAAVVTGLRKRLDVFEAQAGAARSEFAADRAREKAWMSSPSVPEVR